MDTTVHLTAIEEKDGFEISVIRRSGTNTVRKQMEVAGDQDM
jgi:hypothetical protein